MSQIPIRIDVQIDAAAAGIITESQLQRAALAVLEAEGESGPAELSLVVTTDENIRTLNRTYRNVDAPTDVLAFGESQTDCFVPAPGAPRYLGDVVVSFERAGEQAQRAGHAVESEMVLLVVHGVLHLVGHDHAEEQERDRMWSAQASVLSHLQVPVANPTPEEGN